MKKHIVLISGSGSENAHTLALIKSLESIIQECGLKTTIWDLQKNPLPFMDPLHHGDEMHPNLKTREFINLIDQADGIILGTPIYHGSFSGILKNALDNLGDEAFKNKPVGLISNAGGMGNTQACEQLRSIVRSLYGYALQTQIVSSEDDFEDLGSSKKLINKSIKKRCLRLVNELITFTDFFHKAKNSTQIRIAHQ